MVPQNTLKWTVTLLVAAAWTFAPGPQIGAQPPRNAGETPGTPPSAPFPDGSEAPFDSTITVPELLEKAREAFGLDKHDLAETFYREILIRDRSNVQAMLELANVYERNGKLEYARGLLVRSAKLDPANEAIVKRLAAVEHVLRVVLAVEVDSLIAASRYELAIPKLSVAISIEPDNPELLYKRALCYSHLGRPDAALSNIDKALRIDQKEKYYQLRSVILEEIKELETREMVAQAKRLILTDDPASRQSALEVLGEILQADPEHDWAKAEFLRLSRSQEAGETGVEVGTDSEAGRSTARGVLSFVARVGGAVGDLIQNHLNAILLLVAAIVVFCSPLTKLTTKLITRLIAPRAFLTGRFPKFTLTEILVMLNSESHTGVLHVKGESGCGKIYFEKGEPCHCTAGKMIGVKALHHLLNSTKVGQFEFGDGSIPLNRTMDTPLSVVLMEHASDRTGGTVRRKRRNKAKPEKPKSRMKELLEHKSGK